MKKLLPDFKAFKNSSFRLPLIVGVGLILSCAVGWSFFMGYMVGRGQNPQARIEAITGLSQASSEAPAPIIDISPTPPLEETTGNIHSDLPAPPPARQFANPQGEELSAWESIDKNPPARPQAKPAQNTRAPAPRAKTGPVYDFTFQLAAIKNPQEAQKLVKRLDNAGISARSQKSGKVMLVISTLRGRDSDAEQLRKKLLSLKLGKPLLLSKKETTAKGQRKK